MQLKALGQWMGKHRFPEHHRWLGDVQPTSSNEAFQANYNPLRTVSAWLGIK